MWVAVWGTAGTVSACAATQPPLTSEPAARGVVSGRVVDGTDARPLADATVTLVDTARGFRQSTTTEASGRYVLEGVPPGRYLVSAEAPGYVAQVLGQSSWAPEGTPLDLPPGGRLTEVSFRLRRESVILGRILDPAGRPAVGALVQALRLSAREATLGLVTIGRTTTGADGGYQLSGLPSGEYYVAATPPGPDAESVVAPTYYPGVASLDEARRVAVAPGDRATGLEFALRLVRRVRVSGRIVTPDAQPLRTGAVLLSPSLGDVGRFGPVVAAQLQPDGQFTFVGVVPGRHALVARGETVPGLPLFGTFVVTVTDRDLANLEIPLRTGTVIAGELVFEGGSPPPPARLAQIVIRAPALEGPARGTDAAGFPRPDGSFELHALAGMRRLEIEGLPEPWVLKGIYYQGRDVTDRPLVLGEGRPLTGVRVVLTTEAATLAGRVRTTDAQPLTGYAVVVMPDDPTLWVPGSRRVRLVPVEMDGRFRVRDLPPGSYLAAVVDGLDEADLVAPSLLVRLAERAARINLRSGETTVLDLQVPSSPLAARRSAPWCGPHLWAQRSLRPAALRAPMLGTR